MAVAALRQRRSNPTSFTCNEAVGIEKGTLLALTDDRTAIKNSASGSMMAGVCAREKIAGDGRTVVGVFTDGIFDFLFSGSGSAGDAVIGASASIDAVMKASVAEKAREILGHLLEDATNAQTVQVELNIGGGGNQVT